MGADMYRGVLPAKLVELRATAVDASCTHLYTPGIHRHVQGALAQGGTVEEIMEVLKLCGALGVDACELGAPILSQELANQETRQEVNAAGRNALHRRAAPASAYCVCSQGINATRFSRSSPGRPSFTPRIG